jgi:excinuclease ABC subunit B
MAEDLTEHYGDVGVRVRYLHSDIDTLERIEIIRALRQGEFDVLVGINLLREGLDLPEVSLVAILDADKEGFLRAERSLIQTIGRAARNVHGKVIMYADRITPAMRAAIDETRRRRDVQERHNQEHGVTPETVKRQILDLRGSIYEADYVDVPRVAEGPGVEDLPAAIEDLRKQMYAAAEEMAFEKAAALRDRIRSLEQRDLAVREPGSPRGRQGPGRPRRPARGRSRAGGPR